MPPREQDTIDKAISKATKTKLKRKANKAKQALPTFTQADVARCLELLQEVEKNNGHLGIAKLLRAEGIVMTGADVRRIDEARAKRLAELEAEDAPVFEPDPRD